MSCLPAQPAALPNGKDSFIMPETATYVVAGVDTHKDTHHAAVVTQTGTLIADQAFPVTKNGYNQLREFITSYGPLALAGVEGTNSYGAGLARHLRAHHITVKEIIRPKRTPRRQGKSDPIDALAAARTALNEPDHLPTPKTCDGLVEELRMTRTAHTSAVKARTAATAAVKAMITTAPEPVRTALEPLTKNTKTLITHLTTINPPPAGTGPETGAWRALHHYATRITTLNKEINTHAAAITHLVHTINPALATTCGYGTLNAADLLITAGDNPERLTTTRAFAALCGASPVPASSGKTNRHRLNRGGDRTANAALHRIAVTRLAWDPRTQAYRDRLKTRGKTTKEILRCLKTAIAHEAFHLITHPTPPPPIDDLHPLRHALKIPQWKAAAALNTTPHTISRIERGTKRDDTLTHHYRTWLHNHQPTT
jgi:transposase